jgi:hypothetical protein
MNVNVSLWHKELLLAATDEDLLCIVRDYLVLWRPDDLAELPVPCIPGGFEDARAVTEYAAILLAQHPDSTSYSGAREALTAFFTVAARRVAELSVSPPAPVQTSENATA